jgi:hypothetical protein
MVVLAAAWRPDEPFVMRSKVGFWIVVGLLSACAGCDALKSKDPEGDKSSAPTAATSAPVASASASASSDVSPAVVELDIPGRSKVPSLDEWEGVKEVTVKGSSALNCETKLVREWLRVWCRGVNDSGGRPSTVRIEAGAQPGTTSYAVGGVTSLITPFVAGTHLTAVFSWTDKSHRLVLDWPATAKMPGILGVFEGAKSPLDRLTGASEHLDWVCACERQNPLFRTPNPDLDCKEVSVNEDCAYTYRAQCLNYQKCSIGEPAMMPKCRPGHVRVGVGSCAKSCTKDSECSDGLKCVPSAFDETQRVCASA